MGVKRKEALVEREKEQKYDDMKVLLKCLLSLAGLGFACVYAVQFYRVNTSHNSSQTRKSRRGRLELVDEDEEPSLVCKDANEHLHAFYYPWYGTPDQDGEWVHWNHQLMPHWTERVNRQFNGTKL